MTEPRFETAVSKSVSRLASESKDACRNLEGYLKILRCSPESQGRSTACLMEHFVLVRVGKSGN
jgi:hypothetical protein